MAHKKRIKCRPKVAQIRSSSGLWYVDRWIIPMPYHVKEFESTPNPNAMKCWLDRPISDGPRSFFNASMAAADPVAAALFADAGVTNVLFHGDWMTVNKLPESDWDAVQLKVKRVLKDAV